jgi:uncharacterized protein YggT (Ycf19 family)
MLVDYGSDQIHRRYLAGVADPGVPIALPVSAGKSGLSRSHGRCRGPHHQLAHIAAAPPVAAARKGRYGHRRGGRGRCGGQDSRVICAVRGGYGDWLLFLRITLVAIIDLTLRVYLFALLLYWLTSFVTPGGYAPGVRLLGQLCEPVLKPVRRIIPPIGQIDFSVLWVSIAIGALLILLR